MIFTAYRSPSRLLTAAIACALAAGLTLGSATQARASDPASAVVAGLIVWAVVAQQPRHKCYKSCYRSKVIARYCGNPKTGLYYKC